ncbi:MAG: NYN domain-containing protein [Elainellaceae cyanobacterium]
MADIVSKKKALVKRTQTRSKQKSSFTKTSLQPQAVVAPTVTKTSVPGQRDRGRVIVFIDGSNLFYAASKLNTEIDYVKLLQYLVANDFLVHVFFYTGYDPTNEKQYRFLQWMRYIGFRIITKAVTQDANSPKKANLDVEIAVDMMRLAQHCDTAVLVSGDGDFVYVVNAIAAQGVRVEVVGLRAMTSSSLIDVANCYVDLASIQQTIQKFDDRAAQPSVVLQG